MKNPKCPRGCGRASYAQANYCGRCGTPLRAVTKSTGTAIPMVRKVAGASATKAAKMRRVMPASFYAEPDPAIRELMWKAAYGPSLTKAR